MFTLTSPDENTFELIRTETVLQTAATTLSETFTGLRLQNLHTTRVVAKMNDAEIPGSMAEESVRVPLFRLIPAKIH
ncbi:MAG: hypothetical protein ACNYNY_00700 [Candidatus Oxydemutatoraceae bacterium WSBS_2016_MAG_OTU14]